MKHDHNVGIDWRSSIRVATSSVNLPPYKNFIYLKVKFGSLLLLPKKRLIHFEYNFTVERDPGIQT